MSIYLCWDLDCGTVDEAVSVKAFSEEQAAEVFAEKAFHRDPEDAGSGYRVAVANADGPANAYDVTVESVPVFRASRATPEPPPPKEER
jgi:hypothetical protein